VTNLTRFRLYLVECFLVKVLLWVWQLPQNLLGLFLVLVLRAKHNVVLSVYFVDAVFGVSLGDYVILYSGSPRSVLKHEKGHQVQSRWLGPLYLLVVGIPSAVFNNLWDRLFHKKWSMKERSRWYYSRWPEGPGGHWWDRFTADVLGGVKRV
jgi:hypothetical protein